MLIETTTQRQLFTGSVTATELFANSFTTLSANIQILDITMYEISGFRATGPVSITDEINSYSAFTITQPGSGYTFVANDENPDSSPFVINASGFVGIGTLTPSQKLTLFGNSLFVGTGTFKSDDDSAKNLRLQRSTVNGRAQISLEDELSNEMWVLGTTNSNNPTFNLTNALGTFVTVTSTGLVGINNNSPTKRLSINGDVNITKDGTAITLDSGAAANANIDFKYNGTTEAQLTVTGTGISLTGDSVTLGTVADTSQLVVNNNGNIGIGTSLATQKLTLFGNLSASGVGQFSSLSGNELFVDNIGKPINLNSHSLTNANIDSGNIDGVTINGSSVGLTTQAQARFTTLTATGITITSVVQNQVYASPNASTGDAAFRALVASDIPNLDAGKITTGTLPVGRGGTGATTFTANAVLLGNGTGAFSTVSGLTTTLSALSSNNTPFRLTFTNGVLTSFGF